MFREEQELNKILVEGTDSRKLIIRNGHETTRLSSERFLDRKPRQPSSPERLERQGLLAPR